MPLLLTQAGGPAGSGSPDLTTGLVAYYRLEGGYTDSSGNGNNLSAAGLDFGSGKLGQGATGGSGTTASLSLDEPFSVSAWVQAPEGDDTWNALLFTGGLTPRGGLRLTYNRGATAAFIIRDFDVTGEPASYTAPSGAFNHYVIVFETTGTTLYVNGVEAIVGSAMSAGTFNTFVLSPEGAAPTYLSIDEVAVYSIALSPAQVGALYNGGAGFDPTA